MRFCSAVLLAVLAIAPVCAERVKVSDERRVIDSTLSIDTWIAAAAVCAPAVTVLPVCIPGGGGSMTMTTTTTRKRRRWCLPQTRGDGSCRRHFAGGDDDDEKGARPSRRWNNKDGQDNDIRQPEETDVTTTMINLCAVSKKRRRDDDDTRRHAETTRTRQGTRSGIKVRRGRGCAAAGPKHKTRPRPRCAHWNRRPALAERTNSTIN
jgi:hypothetical protein